MLVIVAKKYNASDDEFMKLNELKFPWPLVNAIKESPRGKKRDFRSAYSPRTFLVLLSYFKIFLK
jgi:hypothetical protein